MKALALAALLLTGGCASSLLESDPGEPDSVIAWQTDCGPACDIASPYPGSLSVVYGPRPVSAGGLWRGFHEAKVTSDANTNGRTYELEARWNMVDEEPVATLLQMVGGGNKGWVREAYSQGRAFQEELRAMGVRTVMVQYSRGSELFPKNGWGNIASTYADLIGWLIERGIIEGGLYAYGNSGGATMTAHTLINQKVPFRGVLLGGGPFGIDFLEYGCSLNEINEFCFEDVGGCASAGAHLRACRSMTGPDSGRLFPDTSISIIVGTNDNKGAFILTEVGRLLDRVVALDERLVQPVAPHAILNAVAGKDALLAEFVHALSIER